MGAKQRVLGAQHSPRRALSRSGLVDPGLGTSAPWGAQALAEPGSHSRAAVRTQISMKVIFSQIFLQPTPFSSLKGIEFLFPCRALEERRRGTRRRRRGARAPCAAELLFVQSAQGDLAPAPTGARLAQVRCPEHLQGLQASTSSVRGRHPAMMARLLARACCPKALPQRPRCPPGSVTARAWSNGPLTAYMPEAAAFHKPKDHQGLYEVSVEQGDAFWGALGRSRLTWITPFHSVQDCDLRQGRVSWFLGGQLNVSGKEGGGHGSPPSACRCLSVKGFGPGSRLEEHRVKWLV